MTAEVTAIVAASGIVVGATTMALAMPTRLTTLDMAAAKSDALIVPGWVPATVPVKVFLMLTVEEKRESMFAPSPTGAATDFPIICTKPIPTWSRPVVVPRIPEKSFTFPCVTGRIFNGVV
ncbi:hypothetical protein WJ972_14790 [Achromobacter insuavis]